MSDAVKLRAWVAPVGWLIVIATTAGLIWGMTHDLGSVAVCLFLGFSLPPLFDCFQFLFFYGHGKPARKSLSIRFSIWQIMIVAGATAGYLAILRALFTAYPVQERGIVLLLSGSLLILYVIFCGLARVIWVGVRNFRAVLSKEREKNLMFKLAWQEQRAKVKTSQLDDE